MVSTPTTGFPRLRPVRAALAATVAVPVLLTAAQVGLAGPALALGSAAVGSAAAGSAAGGSSASGSASGSAALGLNAETLASMVPGIVQSLIVNGIAGMTNAGSSAGSSLLGVGSSYLLPGNNSSNQGGNTQGGTNAQGNSANSQPNAQNGGNALPPNTCMDKDGLYVNCQSLGH
ncbi:hypothetical protein [Nocardia sp. CDC160]|uniref:hypothetical protein n=1 Tax=Nocardia sp. CDC160 TaxID=3112166 RepID=UPI002DBC02DF|nr:hypothetical protein [Nocardia sp. CDC160]MEC3917311.1 hypothetical protein [Nocardia sp. CDC160]